MPNLLTALRIVLAFALLPISAEAWPFVVVFLLAAGTDAADGRLARRWRVQSRSGAALDSVADVCFTVLTVVALLWRGLLWHDDQARTIVVAVGGAVILLRLVNLAVARVRFRHWGGVHTIGNKVAGPVFVPTVVALALVPETSVAVLAPLALVSAVAAIEETLILATADRFDPDRTGLVDLRRNGLGQADQRAVPGDCPTCAR